MPGPGTGGHRSASRTGMAEAGRRSPPGGSALPPVLLPGLLLLAVALLPGCHLVDQRTFDPAAGRPPVPPAPPPAVTAAPVPPLLTIRYDGPPPDYADALRVAVRRALDRKPDVLFEVVTVVPARGTPAQQVADAQAGSAGGRAVAQAIVGDGADAGQVEMAARAEPGVTAREVRVYVH